MHMGLGRKWVKAPIVSAALMVLVATAAADTIALSSSRTTGNQAWPEALGMDFDVYTPITVTQLGAFDSGLDGFGADVAVGIFNRVSGVLVGNSALLSGVGNPLVGNQRFADVANFDLGIGQYSIVAVGFGASNLNGNTDFGGSGPTIDTAGGLIGFVGTARYNNSGNSSLALPSIIDGGPANRYDAGTFQYTAVVPEAEGYALALAGIGVVAYGMRRRRTGSV